MVRGCAARHRWIGLNEVKAAKLQIYAAHLALWHDGKPHDHSEITIIHIGRSIAWASYGMMLQTATFPSG